MSNQVNSQTFPLVLESMGVKRIYFTSTYQKKGFTVKLFCKPPKYKKMKFESFGKTLTEAFLKLIYKIQSLENLETYYKEEEVSCLPFSYYPKSMKERLQNCPKYAEWQLKRAIRFYEKLNYQTVKIELV